MKRGRKRLDGLDDLLPGLYFVREKIRELAVASNSPRYVANSARTITERDRDFLFRYRRGDTLAEIGREYGITRERVRQRLTICFGAVANSGGASARRIFKAKDARAEAKAKLEARCLRMFGISLQTFYEITGRNTIKGAWHKRHPIITAYLNQRRSARNRGIEWQFTLATWWEVWSDSGKWAERGTGKGYCMARWGDSGPYGPENVYICTIAQNFSDSFLSGKRKSKRAELLAA